MESLIFVMGINLAAVLCLMIGVWILSLFLRDASIADIFWGPGFVLVAWLTFFLADGYWNRRLLMALLVSAWGLRLAVHIGVRNLGKGEDRRYRAWRKKHGRRFWWVSLFTVFGMQGLLLWVISLVVQAAQTSALPDRWVWWDTVGVLLWGVGFAFEAVADWQLHRFKADPAHQGRVMDRGLWAYSRHPNYFGEALMWWGLFLVTLSTPNSLWTVVSPLTITFLLLRVSGVTLLEKTIVETRPEYRSYMERTRAFLPWFPKKRAR